MCVCVYVCVYFLAHIHKTDSVCEVNQQQQQPLALLLQALVLLFWLERSTNTHTTTTCMRQTDRQTDLPVRESIV